ncbi:MAG TPA: 50S ribosomal protein L14 [Candidatus Absconditabacterales bacterium]|nr:50S ribosomal protein L14 [Candidatus Absconditabacterales bacterium]
MLKNESVINIADNTGAKKAKIIRILKGSTGKTATVGDSVVVAVKDAMPNGSAKKGMVTQAIIVRVKKEIPRKDGSYIRFEDNAAILMTKNEKGEMSPIGKRIFGPVAKELRELGYRNITNMAEEVL